jgi:hypothetical protein
VSYLSHFLFSGPPIIESHSSHFLFSGPIIEAYLSHFLFSGPPIIESVSQNASAYGPQKVDTNFDLKVKLIFYGILWYFSSLQNLFPGILWS